MKKEAVWPIIEQKKMKKKAETNWRGPQIINKAQSLIWFYLWEASERRQRKINKTTSDWFNQ